METQEKKVRVVSIGGGGGQSTLIRALLPHLNNIKLDAVVPVTDSGGSTRILHEGLGAPSALGDLTKCLAVVSSNPTLAEGAEFKFPQLKHSPDKWKAGAAEIATKGGIAKSVAGHSVKNLVGAAEWLRAEGNNNLFLKNVHGVFGAPENFRVWPASAKSSNFQSWIQLGGRKVKITSETGLDTLAQENILWDGEKVLQVEISPRVSVLPEVVEAVDQADYILISPGDTFTSIVAVLLVRGLKKAIKRSKAKIIMIVNVMTKPGETHGLSAQDHIKLVSKYLGRPVDVAICNENGIKEDQVRAYQKEHKAKVVIGEKPLPRTKIVRAHLIDSNQEEWVRHDPEKLGAELMNVIAELQNKNLSAFSATK